MYLELDLDQLESVNLTEEGFVAESSLTDNAVGDAASEGAAK